MLDAMAERDELKAEVERLATERGHTPGPWLEVGHAAQLGCLSCDRYAFVQLMPPPPKTFLQGLAEPCPDRGSRLIQMP
jgi:hypothetical protein